MSKYTIEFSAPEIREGAALRIDALNLYVPVRTLTGFEAIIRHSKKTVVWKVKPSGSDVFDLNIFHDVFLYPDGLQGGYVSQWASIRDGQLSYLRLSIGKRWFGFDKHTRPNPSTVSKHFREYCKAFNEQFADEYILRLSYFAAYNRYVILRAVQEQFHELEKAHCRYADEIGAGELIGLTAEDAVIRFLHMNEE